MEKILDPIYGVDYQFVGKASVSGWIQTNKGWNPILTLSIYNDTSYINNYSMELYKGDSVGKLVRLFRKLKICLPTRNWIIHLIFLILIYQFLKMRSL